MKYKNHYTYLITCIHPIDNREDAMASEIILHNKFDVAKSKEFFNRSKQTSVGFDGFGGSGGKGKKNDKTAGQGLLKLEG